MSQNTNGTFSLDHRHIIHTQKKKQKQKKKNKKKIKMKKKVRFPVFYIPVVWSVSHFSVMLVLGSRATGWYPSKKLIYFFTYIRLALVLACRFFRQHFPNKRVFSVSNRNIEHCYWIELTEFHLKEKSLVLWTKFAKKRYFPHKAERGT